MARRPWWWLPSKPMMSPSSAKVDATAAPLRRFHPSRNCTYSVRMAASCGWAAVTSELLGRAGTHVTLVVALPLPFDPRRAAPEPVLAVLPQSRSAAATTHRRGGGDQPGGRHDRPGQRPDRRARPGVRIA